MSETNSDFSSEEVALRYKELWQVEHVFRDMKSIFETRHVYHRLNDTIRGHVFAVFYPWFSQGTSSSS